VNVRRLRRGMDKNLLRDQTFISYWSHLRGAPQRVPKENGVGSFSGDGGDPENEPTPFSFHSFTTEPSVSGSWTFW
jgi:hypothetical protein